MPIVNARMYSVTTECKADWHRVLGWALQRADLEWEIVDHDAPAPLAVTAPVRMSVMSLASKTAIGTPVAGSNRLSSASSDGRPTS
jgi:hypothetical protein